MEKYRYDFKHIYINWENKKHIYVKVRNRSKLKYALREMCLLSALAMKQVTARYEFQKGIHVIEFSSNVPKVVRDFLKTPEYEMITKEGKST